MKSYISLRMCSVLIILVCAIMMTGKSIPSKGVTKEPNVRMEFGFGNQTKINRQVRVVAEIDNWKYEPTGYIQIIISDMNENIMYEKEFNTHGEDSATVEFTVPALYTQPKLQYRILDNQGNQRMEQTVNVKILYSGIMVGILTNEPSSMDYVNKDYTKVYYFDNKDFPTNSISLNTFDLIIVNHYDLYDLSSEQYIALKSWVEEGGSLILGTGLYQEETLNRFLQDNYIKGTIEGGEAEDTTFGFESEDLQMIQKDSATLMKATEYEVQMSSKLPAAQGANDSVNDAAIEDIQNDLAQYDESKEEVPAIPLEPIAKELIDIHIDEAQTILNEDGSVIMQKLDIKTGNIQLFHTDLDLPSEYTETLGDALVYTMQDNLSITKKRQIAEDLDVYGYKGFLYSGLRLADSDRIPRVWSYAGIIFLYIIFSGPILYLILKKQDKRNLTWVLVPVLSLIFSGVIYLNGSKTRVKEPYIEYINIMESDGKGDYSINNYIGVTSPNNKKYDLTLDTVHPVKPLPQLMSYFMDDNRDQSTKIQLKDTQVTVEMDGYAAFQTNYFSTESEYKLNGNIEGRIHSNMGKITGNVTNNMDIDLEYVFLLVDSNLIFVGQLPSGDSVAVEQLEQIKFNNTQALYADNLLERLAGDDGLNGRNTNFNKRKYALQYLLLSDNGAMIRTNQLIGFTSESIGDAPLQNSEYEYNGTSLLIHPLKIDYNLDMEQYVPDIYTYMPESDKRYIGTERYLSMDTVEIDYYLPRDKKIKEIQYLKENNPEFDKRLWYGFAGKIYFYNFDSNRYDLVFESRSQRRITITELENYLDKNNHMQIRYSVDRQDPQILTVCLPVLSLLMEAD